MKQIPLTKGFFATVDDADFEALSKFKWCAQIRGKRIYAARNSKPGEFGPDKRMVYMHKQILGVVGKRFDIDHVNGSGTDNWRSNLRSCSRGENMQNRPKQNNNSAGYKGVYFDKQRGKFSAAIVSNGTKYHLGRFLTAETAAKAYDAKATLLHGEFARLNF